MYCEWPVFTRCCFCLPLRRGILILAYFDLLCCILELALIPLLGVVMTFHREYTELPAQLNFILFVLDKIATILLIIGLHMKRELLIWIYYNFMIATLAASVLLTIIDVSMMEHVHMMIYAGIAYFFTTAFTIYLLLLVRSMTRKLQVSEGNTFDNRLVDFIDGRPVETQDNHTIIQTA